MPGVFGGGGRSGHGRCEQPLHYCRVHFSGRIDPNAPSLEDKLEFFVHLGIHKTATFCALFAQWHSADLLRRLASSKQPTEGRCTLAEPLICPLVETT